MFLHCHWCDVFPRGVSGPDAAAIREQHGDDVASAVFTNLPGSVSAVESAHIMLRTIKRLDPKPVVDPRPYYEQF